MTKQHAVEMIRKGLSYLLNNRGSLILERSELGTITADADVTRNFEIEEARLIHTLELHLRGRLNITGGTTNGTLVNENPQRYVNRVRILGTPKSVAADRVPKDLRGQDIYALHQIYARTSPLRTQVSAGVTNKDFEVFLPITFPPPDAPPNVAGRFLFPSNMFSRTNLEVTTGTANGDLVSGGDRTKALQAFGSASGNPEVRVVAVRVLNIDPRNYNPWVYKQRILDFDRAIATATTEQRLTFVSRGPIYRSLVHKTFINDGVAETPTANLFDGYEVQIDRRVNFFDFRGSADARGYKKMVKQGLDDRVPNNDPTGYIVAEFVNRAGRFNRAFNSRELIEGGLPLDLVLEISSGTATTNAALDTLSNELVPPVQGV